MFSLLNVLWLKWEWNYELALDFLKDAAEWTCWFCKNIAVLFSVPTWRNCLLSRSTPSPVPVLGKHPNSSEDRSWQRPEGGESGLKCVMVILNVRKQISSTRILSLWLIWQRNNCEDDLSVSGTSTFYTAWPCGILSP